ncbi:SWIB/MDM2 domain-containing protein [Methylopila sp. Yamaguchi]|uniref:SWIB/MDM2 domain-containing protein n=1 Tax=Methylopila sp. Yamaguchi TaxID=1437817 RepID=UPI000CCB13B6|nr:SWIB/MDM2 domain-containing protein [Methylopila sp. Yamaguchi]GBD50710.1 SWIB/MDM2 domain-containing protein [Methylopila sp. Yamaguchi]
MAAAKKTETKTAAKTSAAKAETKSPAKPKAPAKAKSADKPKSSGAKKPNALSVEVKPSADLAAIVGDKPLPRSEVVSKTWDYIKKHKLQNPDDGREILADANLEKIFGKKKATMFEMNKFLNAHLS